MTGRACWLIAGTICNGVAQDSFEQKLPLCLNCEFFSHARREAGPAFDRNLIQFILERPKDEIPVTLMAFFHEFFGVLENSIAQTIGLRHLHEQFEAAEQLGNFGSWEHEIHTGEITGSKGAAAIFGLPHGVLTYEALLAMVIPEDRAALLQVPESFGHQAASYNLEYRILRSDAAIRTVQVIGKFVRDKAGKLIKIMGSIQDMTAVREHERALAQSQTLLFQTAKLASLGEMSAGLAHEINQPLTGIALAVQMIELLKSRNILTDVELKNLLKKINTSIERCDRIVKHVRAFARQDELKFERVHVDSTIESAFLLMGQALRIQDIEITQNLSTQERLIKGEAFQLEQVWINLIGNSRDAMEEMAIESRTAQVPYTKKLTISSKVEDAHILVEVSDNGIGMTENVKKKAFEPFFTTKPVGKGTGLGMSITHGILQAHHATIEIQSESKKGTTITVRIPLLQ